MGYEIYTRETMRVSTPTITLNARGRLVFNVAATKFLHDLGVETVFLLWDSELHKFAVKVTSKRDVRAVTVRYSGGGKWAAISARGFLVKVGHDMSTTKAYPATWNAEQGMFEVSMGVAQGEPAETTKPVQTRRNVPTSKQVSASRSAVR
ncbi:MAG TPA: hypothetical protein VGR72_06750 [Candidatus Acidoferrales bacterium]|nr:hypothetical protein [Candidatus Acidoferrales bacterium]